MSPDTKDAVASSVHPHDTRRAHDHAGVTPRSGEIASDVHPLHPSFAEDTKWKAHLQVAPTSSPRKPTSRIQRPRFITLFVVSSALITFLIISYSQELDPGSMLVPAAFLTVLGWLLPAARGLVLEVQPDGGNRSGLLPVGIMFEDVNRAGDGGLHGQLLSNNGFQGSDPDLFGYQSFGNVTLSISDEPLDVLNSVSGGLLADWSGRNAINRTLLVDFSGAKGQVGFSNNGYWGMKLPAGEYRSSFWVANKAPESVIQSKPGPKEITVRLLSDKTNTTIFASAKVPLIFNNGGKWSKVNFVMNVTEQAPDGKNLWLLTFDADEVPGGQLHFSLPTLYAPTYKDRTNGLKLELAQPLADIKGRFLRFLGGNNLEGNSIEGRLKWYETIGPLEKRPGRQGVWGYGNSDALGLLEYLYWTEDMNLEPLMNVFAGLALGGEQVTGDALEPYIEDALNQIEYAVGDNTTHWGPVRAAHGRQEPFDVKYVEIGNEDNLEDGCSSYPERFQRFYDAIHKAYPKITIIASTAQLDCLPKEIPKEAWLDYHLYGTPDEFVERFNYFDNIPRTNKYIVNEFGVINYNENDTKPVYPFMQGSVAEAVYMIGMQRNSDLVQGFAYAPIIMNLDYFELEHNWSPAAIAIRNEPQTLLLSTTYWIQRMFGSTSAPDHTYLNVKANGDFGPVYWVASADNKGASIVKLANYGEEEQDVTVHFAGGSSRATLWALGESPSTTANGQVHPVTAEIMGSGGRFDITMPPWSFAVLVVEAE